MLLNHFRHNALVSFPIYFLISMENRIEENRRNPNKSILHEGFMLLIMEFVKVKYIPKISNISSGCNGKGTLLDYDKVDSTEEWDGDYEVECSEEIDSSKKYSGKKLKKGLDPEASQSWSDGYNTDVEMEAISIGIKNVAKGKKGSRKEVKLDHGKGKGMMGDGDKGTRDNSPNHTRTVPSGKNLKKN